MAVKSSPVVYRVLKAMTTSLGLLLCLYLSINKIYQNILGVTPCWRSREHTRENARETHYLRTNEQVQKRALIEALP